MQALRAFEATARLGSLTRAADALNLTHGAISHQIKALEAELGVALVERAGRGIRLTDEGARFAARVKSALGDIADAVREIGEQRNPRLLRVSVTPSFAARWLLPRMPGFMRAHPEIDLDVSASLTVVDFRREQVHLAVRYGRGGWPDVVSEHLMDDAFFPVCSPRLNGGKLPQQPAHLARYVLLRSEDEYWKPWFEAVGVDLPEPTRGPSFNDSSHMLQAAAEGHGIALGRSTLMGNDLRSGALVRLFDVAVPSPRQFYLVYPPRLAELPKLTAFRSWIRSEIAVEQAAAAAQDTTDPAPGAKPARPAKTRARRATSRSSGRPR